MQSAKTFELNPLSARPTIEQALRLREFRRIRRPGGETIVYDTGQHITRSIELNPGSGIDALRLTTEIVNPRSGQRRFDGASSAKSHAAAWPVQGYPEIRPLVARLCDAMERCSWSSVSRSECSSRGLAERVGRLIFPFERRMGFDLSRGAEHMSERGLLVGPDHVSAGYGGFLACVSAQWIHSAVDSERSLRCIQIRIFNPSYLTSRSKGDTLAACMPDRTNSYFLIECSYGQQGDQQRFDLEVHRYDQEWLSPTRPTRLATIEAERGEGFYFRVDGAMLRALERMAPLPIEHSDCGRELETALTDEASRRQRARGSRGRQTTMNLRAVCNRIAADFGAGRGVWAAAQSESGGQNQLRSVRSRQVTTDMKQLCREIAAGLHEDRAVPSAQSAQ